MPGFLERKMTKLKIKKETKYVVRPVKGKRNYFSGSKEEAELYLKAYYLGYLRAEVESNAHAIPGLKPKTIDDFITEDGIIQSKEKKIFERAFYQGREDYNTL